jgi:hypothetical protein
MERKQIEMELKKSCVPVFRKMGFKGSFPDFYRDVNGFISLINFQFYSSGGSFCINISYADPDRINVYFRKETEVKKLKVSQTTEHFRLGAERQGADHWFSFGKTSYGEYRGKPMPAEDIVSSVNQLISTQAEEWWAKKRDEASS